MKQNMFQIQTVLFFKQSRVKALPLHDKTTAVLWKWFQACDPLDECAQSPEIE